ncbi:FadR/GntR family transcriptional regulator [Pendulispora albinea]|uniref:GntR family transcriptional regulator n=1 Tax=Pendulispora albinea TaxID=2741071 RepID=A0ABZ2LJX0_9BACT
METLAAIGPIARSSVVDAVADRLQDEILSGRLAAGSRLPSEREFALALGVNRLTLRAALARLEALGFIVTRHGAGTVVASWRERAGLEALATLIGSNWSKEGFVKGRAGRELLTAMLEVRRIVASEAIGLAAKRHTAADLEALEQRAREQEGRVVDRVAFARGDIAFERAVLRATRNIGLELLLNTFARFPDEQPGLVAELYDRPEDTLAFYPLIIGLIRAGDPVAARDTLKQLLEAADVAWQARHGEAGPKSGASKRSATTEDDSYSGAGGARSASKSSGASGRRGDPTAGARGRA